MGISCIALMFSGFQSTLSVRRATVLLVYARVRAGISIHALRKESDGIFANIRCFGVISIHALRKESDPRFSLDLPPSLFQSTLSVRRATWGITCTSRRA